MKYLIAGLGNVGEEYEGTRHNAGFMVLDALAGASGTSFSVERLGAVAMCRVKGRQLLLLKPSTYMNLSGKAIQYWLQKEKLGVESLLVVVDDLALPLGEVRLRAQGSAGGHNGLKDIEGKLGTSGFARLRVGVGHDFPRGRQIDYVLSKFSAEEQPLLAGAVQKAQEAVALSVTIGIDRAMNAVNTKSNPRGDGADADR